MREREPEPLYCYDCTYEKGDGEYACPDCGCDVWIPYVRAGATALPADPADELRGILSGIWLPPGRLLGLYGLGGSGKTSIALQALTRPWLDTSEMDAALCLHYAARLDVAIVRAYDCAADELGTCRFPEPEPDQFDLMDGRILDSVSEAPGLDVDVLRRFKRWCRQARKRGIATFHATKTPVDLRGPSTLRHACDAIVRLEDGRMTVEKNRFGKLFSRAYKLGKEGATLPPWDRYYSVEGGAGAYRLVEYPPGGKYSDPLREADAGRLELPPPPLAVACQKAGKLYKSGWIAPVDIDDRAAFAAEHGLEFWRPKDATSAR